MARGTLARAGIVALVAGAAVLVLLAAGCGGEDGDPVVASELTAEEACWTQGERWCAWFGACVGDDEPPEGCVESYVEGCLVRFEGPAELEQVDACLEAMGDEVPCNRRWTQPAVCY